AVEQAEEEDGEPDARGPREDVDVDVEAAAQDRADDVREPLEQDVGAEEGQDRVKGQESPDRIAEEERAQPVEESEVDLGVPVDAGERAAEAPVHAEERVARDELAGAEVVELELVARQGVADVADAEEAALERAVAQLGDELVARDPLGQVAR